MRQTCAVMALFVVFGGIVCGGGVGPASAQPASGDGVVRFTHLAPTATEVYLVGDFNGWSPTATPLDPERDGTWVALVFLDPGTYEYMLLVDGAWKPDPANPELSSSGNSLVCVGTAGTVLPCGGSAAGGSGGAGSDSRGGTPENVLWSVRYLGFFTSRRDRAQDRYDLERPTHDVDVRLDAALGSEVKAWFLTNFNNIEEGSELSRTTLRFDRGVVTWEPAPFEVRFFDNEGVTDFEDPGALVGNVGLYGDAFGYERRGVVVRRRILGAPLEFLYADDTEDAAPAPPTSLPQLHEPGAGALDGTTALRYASSTSDRNADALAFRFRAGTADAGLGVGYRIDRGAAAGRLSEISVQSDSIGLLGRGLEYETTESWRAWQLDLRLRVLGARVIGEFMSGTREANANRLTQVEELRADGSGTRTVGSFSTPIAAGVDFELDDSRRAILRLDAGKSGDSGWLPEVGVAYQENDFTALVTGKPFLMRHSSVHAGWKHRLGPLEARVDVQHDWFDYPDGAIWETQFWFRRHNFWLDEDTAQFHRLTLLGADRAAAARLEAAATLWPRRQLDGRARLTYAAPGFDRAPRYLETVLRFSIPVRDGLHLRTHTRLATYRRVATADADFVSILGPGPHVEAGELARRSFDDATHDYRTFAAHFVELVYELSSRSDVALGFGVDPIALYEVRNEYLDNGWDQFLFSEGASPSAAFNDPVRLGARIEAAERQLERERRLTLEARIRF